MHFVYFQILFIHDVSPFPDLIGAARRKTGGKYLEPCNPKSNEHNKTLGIWMRRFDMRRGTVLFGFLGRSSSSPWHYSHHFEHASAYAPTDSASALPLWSHCRASPRYPMAREDTQIQSTSSIGKAAICLGNTRTKQGNGAMDVRQPARSDRPRTRPVRPSRAVRVASSNAAQPPPLNRATAAAASRQERCRSNTI